MRHLNRYAAVSGAIMAACLLVACPSAAPEPDLFPIAPKPLIPTHPRAETQIGTGAVTAHEVDQPIAFPHDRHIEVAGLSCEFCHTAARHSIHAGVPPVQTCMGCHRFILPDSPEVQIIHEHWNAAQPIPWNRVHDLPDFVYFSHKRHVRAGVECSECHGLVETMSGERIKRYDEGVMIERVEGAMYRVATLQMGWCLDCHGEHPTIDQNYEGDADLRRAELKDCWACHK